MTVEEFWRIVESTHDPDMNRNERALSAALNELPIREVIEFDRIWTDRFCELYAYPLWGVACLVLGSCSDDGFMDWRDWVVSGGQRVFELARDSPDDLVDMFDGEPNAGMEGIGYVHQRCVEDRSDEFDEPYPDYDICEIHPDQPSGLNWQSHAQLKELLPKCYAKYYSRLCISIEGDPITST